jgi:cytidine deaminase
MPRPAVASRPLAGQDGAHAPRCSAMPPPDPQLVQAAQHVRLHAHAPYSHITVGAALRGVSGRVYSGCNVENASYGLTVCAERNAVFAAVAAGETTFTALAVASEKGMTCCGACLQVLSEFAADLPVTLVDGAGRTRGTSLLELLPQPPQIF